MYRTSYGLCMSIMISLWPVQTKSPDKFEECHAFSIFFAEKGVALRLRYYTLRMALGNTFEG